VQESQDSQPPVHQPPLRLSPHARLSMLSCDTLYTWLPRCPPTFLSKSFVYLRLRCLIRSKLTVRLLCSFHRRVRSVPVFPVLPSSGRGGYRYSPFDFDSFLLGSLRNHQAVCFILDASRRIVTLVAWVPSAERFAVRVPANTSDDPVHSVTPLTGILVGPIPFVTIYENLGTSIWSAFPLFSSSSLALGGVADAPFHF